MKINYLPISAITVAFLLYCLVISSNNQAYSAQESLTISTDKTSYRYGDSYTFSGKVDPVVQNQLVSIEILHPSYPHPELISLVPNVNGSYSHTIPLALKAIPSGNFSIIASYAGARNQTTFGYVGPGCSPQNSFPVPMIHGMPADNPRIVDSFGNAITGAVKVGQQIQITADLANGQDCVEPFVYIVQIQDSKGVTQSLSWITGTLAVGQSLNPAQSWTPQYDGAYTAQIFTWDSLDNPNALAPPMSVSFVVNQNPNFTQSSQILPKISSPCNTGFIQVIKKENNSTACVTPQTVQKLVERGWAKHSTGVTTLENLNSTKLQVQNPFSADKNGKIDLSQISLPPTKYGQVDYDKIGYLVSENEFKRMLSQLNMGYADENYLLIQGDELTSYPPFTSYCGYVLDDNQQEHWFSSSFHYDTLTSHTISKNNPEPCKPSFESCSCRLQTMIAENNLKQLSYFSKSEEESVGESISEYIDKTKIANVSNQFVVGKYNLESISADTHFCGSFTNGAGLTDFEGYITNGTVVYFSLTTEKPKLCAISNDAQTFTFDKSSIVH